MSSLYMIKIGAKPKGRLIEQHDIFFGVADDISELVPIVDKHWPEVSGKWHFDAYRTVTKVDNYRVEWSEENQLETDLNGLKLFFINLGGYLPGHFEEYHHKLLIVATNQDEAVSIAKEKDFYQQYTYDDGGCASSVSHIDDKMSVDIDDIYDVNGLLSQGRLIITAITENIDLPEDEQVIGYISLKSMKS